MTRRGWQGEAAHSFNEGRAAELLGKHVLVGMTYLDHHGDLEERVQFHGVVVIANRESGIVLELAATGGYFALPPDPTCFLDAAPGEYRLRATGEVVVDPDFTTSWTLRRPAPSETRADGALVVHGHE